MSSHTYCQETGEWFDPLGALFFLAYAGRELGLNNPTMDGVHDIGPLPAGTYTISELQDEVGAKGFGPGFLYLAPDPSNAMKGRAGFLVHWDLSNHKLKPHAASHGCIVPYSGYFIKKLASHSCKTLIVKP